MKIVSTADMKAYLNTYMKEGKTEPAIIMHKGKPTALSVSVVDEDGMDDLFLTDSSKFRVILQAAREEISQMGGIPHDEFWQPIDAEY